MKPTLNVRNLPPVSKNPHPKTNDFGRILWANGLLALGLLSSQVFALSPTEMSYFLNPTGKVLKASWSSIPDRTYFLQYSTDLVHWEYSPQIHSGTGEILKYGFDTTGRKGLFIRQVSTDEITTNADTADFDQDGFANIVELQQGSDPFSPETAVGDPTNTAKENTRSKLLLSNLPPQQLSNGQILSNGITGTTTVVLSGSASGQISADGIVWGGGIPGNYRGLLTQAAPPNAGRAVITTLMTTGQGDMNSITGFTSNGALNGLSATNGMSLGLQRSANNNYNRLVTLAGSGNGWVEMTQAIATNTEYRTMVRKESDGFSSWIQGGMYADMGAKINSAVWFPLSRWKGINPTNTLRAGLYNSWVGPTQNSEFSDVENPAMDATSALLDYERNKNGLHIPSLIQLQDGRLLAGWQNNTFHDSNDCVIKLALRNSRGIWGQVSTVVSAGSDGASNNGPVLHQAGDKIWLTYLSITNGIFKVRKRDVTITESGLITLGNPVTQFENGLVLNHMLTLSNRRIVACWHTDSTVWKNLISYSDDGGTTWKSSTMPQFAYRAGEGFAIIEADGTLASYWRTDRGAIYRSTSNDDGKTWTGLLPTAIPCANMPSQGLIGSRVCGYKRPSDGKIVLVGNNSTTQREKLTAWLINNGEIEGIQSLLPWDLPDGSAEGIHYPDVVVEPDDSMTVITARWLGGGFGSSELHSAINTFRVRAAFR